MVYIIKGDPIPLARARHTAYSVYDAQKEVRRFQKIELERQHTGDAIVAHKPLVLVVRFYMRMPSSWSHKKRSSMEGKPHCIKPDLSNLVKWIEDVANTIVYHDDSAIAMTVSHKLYGTEPRTEFSIYNVEGNVWNEDRLSLLAYFLSQLT